MMAEAVRYKNPDTRAESVTLHRLQATNDPQSLYPGNKILELLERTYSDRYERPGEESIQPGSVSRHFNPERHHSVIAATARFNKAIAGGSAYWMAQVAPYAAPNILAKVSPSRATRLQKTHVLPPNCFINDILVDPRIQDQHNGAMALHCALKYSGFSQKAVVSTDVLLGGVSQDGQSGDGIVRRLESLGFAPREDTLVPPLVLAGDGLILQVRYETAKGQDLGGVVEALEEHYGWLAEAEVVDFAGSGWPRPTDQ